MYNLSHSQFESIKNLLASAWGGYGNPIFPLVHYFHIPSEAFLLLTQLLLAVFIGLSCYLFFSKDNRIAGLWALVLYALSVAQTEVYLMFLWKNLLGLFFLLLTFKFLKEKRYILFSLAGLATALSHRSTTIIMLICLGIYFAYTLLKKQHYKTLIPVLLVASGALILVFPAIKNFWITFTNNPNTGVYEGIFLANDNYLLLSLPLVILAAFGSYRYIKNKQHSILNIFAAMSLIWIIFQLPFHNRIVPYLDIALVLYAAYFLASLKKTLANKILIFLFIFLMALESASFITKQLPLISREEINEIKNFMAPRSETLVIALDAADAPWLLGYLQGVRVAAPGLFENRDNYQEWLNFWQGKEQKIFFTRYPKPLVLYQRSFRVLPEVQACSPPISKNFFLYQCP